MEILICQTCGLLLRGEAKSCLSCGTPASKFSATSLPVMANTSAPLAVAVDPDPLVLERVVTARRLGTYKLKLGHGYGEDGNGENGYGENGNGGNGHHTGNGGNGHNGENGHNGGNGHNGENGGNGGNGATTAQNPNSSATGLKAFGMGFLSGGAKQAPTGPLFADNPWGEDDKSTQSPAANAPAASTDPSPSLMNMAGMPSSPADPFAGAAGGSIQASNPFPGFPAPQPLDLSNASSSPAMDSSPGGNPIAAQSGEQSTGSQLPGDPTQGTSPWDKPATQTPFATLDPFASGAQAAQNMFMAQSEPQADPQADPGNALPGVNSGQAGFDSAPTAVASSAQTMQPAAQTQPIDPYSFDSQSQSAQSNQASGSFFDNPATDVRTELTPAPATLTTEPTSNFAVATTSSIDGFDPAMSASLARATTSGDAFDAASATSTQPISVEVMPAEAAPADAPGAETTNDTQGAKENNFAHTAAIAAAAAIAGAAAGAAVTNAINAKSSGGDFFDGGPNVMRSGSTGGTTDEAAFDPFAPSASKPQAASPAQSAGIGAADDFFSAAPIGRPKRDDGSVDESQDSAKSGMSGFDFDGGTSKVRNDDSAFPDESGMRGRKEVSSKVEELEADARPKIARPRGFSPAKDKDSTKLVEKKAETPGQEDGDDFFSGKEVKKNKADSDSDDDDDAADKEDPPPRKSFSGGSTIKRPGVKKKEVVKEKAKGKGKKDEAADDSDDDENLPFLEREMHLGGMTLTNKSAIIVGTICTFMTIVVFNTFCTFCTYLASSVQKNGGTQAAGGLFGGAAPKAIDISGMYMVQYRTKLQPKGAVWQMRLRQDGNNIFAQGADNGAPWILRGQFMPPSTIQFQKAYMKDGKPGQPITYVGKIGVTELGRPAMQGTLKYQTRIGKFWRAQIAEVTGGWMAEQKISGAVLAESEPRQQQQQGSGGMPGDSVTLTPAHGNNPLSMLTPTNDMNARKGDMSGFFLKVAFGLIGIGVLLALVALFIFGPSGKLNILAKQEYIPSQYKAQHNKMMREWSKPYKKGAMPLGTRVEWRFWKPWTPRVMAMPPEARTNNPHMIIIGGSDKGKTRMMANMICHDIEANDRAIIVIDSDGELADSVMNWVAAHQKGKELAKRIITIDPTYRGGSMSYNPLEPLEDVNFIDAASAIVHGFKAIYTEPPGSQSQWNQQTANILRNSAILLMANNKTLIDLPTLLQDNDFRDILLEGVEKKKKERTEYSTLIETWGQYKRLARTDQWINWVEPILNRVTPMLSDPRIRPILTKPVGDLRLRDLITQKQVLLVRIPQGQLDQNGNLLGSLLVTGLKQSALGLAVHESDKQQPCALYLDEMNNFIEKETIEALTQETDKFKIGFVGCCKTLQHLPEDFRNQIIINVGTVCAFALAKKDGDMIGPQMFRVDGRKIKHRTIQNFFNQVNTSPQFELISDEEKLNIDRVVGQETRDFFCYRVGTVAGTFSLKTHDFPDIPKAKIKAKLLEQMHTGVNKKSADA